MKRAKQKIKDLLMEIVGSSKLLCVFYYIIFSRSFYREFFSVFQGRLFYYKDLKNNVGSEFLLRRNTHRLEKGLLMRPLRKVFALDYIEETVKNYIVIKLRAQQIAQKSESFQWATDVLQRYFKTVGDHPVIARAKNLFYDNGDQNDLEVADITKTPYKRIQKEIVSFQQFYDLCVHRRSVRWFLDQEVPMELVRKAIDASKFSPSACNRQPFTFRLFTDKDTACQIGAIPGGTKGFSQNFPAIAVVVGDLSAYPFERDRHVIYIDSSLASMSFMLALETLGLSSCPINWPDVEHFETKMEKVLDLRTFERPIMLIAFGYPDPEGLIAFSEKKGVDEIAIFNKANLEYL